MSDPDLHIKLSPQSSVGNNTGAPTAKPTTPSGEQVQDAFQTVRLKGRKRQTAQCLFYQFI